MVKGRNKLLPCYRALTNNSTELKSLELTFTTLLDIGEDQKHFSVTADCVISSKFSLLSRYSNI